VIGLSVPLALMLLVLGLASVGALVAGAGEAVRDAANGSVRRVDSFDGFAVPLQPSEYRLGAVAVLVGAARLGWRLRPVTAAPLLGRWGAGSSGDSTELDFEPAPVSDRASSAAVGRSSVGASVTA
jgi:hypothetical protein